MIIFKDVRNIDPDSELIVTYDPVFTVKSAGSGSAIVMILSSGEYPYIKI